jgi:hypothetical protein
VEQKERKGEVVRATEDNGPGGLAILSSTLRPDQATPSPIAHHLIALAATDLSGPKRAKPKDVVESHVGAKKASNPRAVGSDRSVTPREKRMEEMMVAMAATVLLALNVVGSGLLAGLIAIALTKTVATWVHLPSPLPPPPSVLYVAFVLYVALHRTSFPFSGFVLDPLSAF